MADTDDMTAPLLTTAEAAQYLGITPAHVRSLVSDRKKAAARGAEVTDATGLPEPQKHNNQRLHLREDLYRYAEAKREQKAQTVVVMRPLLTLTDTRADGKKVAPAPAALQSLYTEIAAQTAELRAHGADMRRVADGLDSLRESVERMTAAQEKANEIAEREAQEKAQKKRRWWQLNG